MKNLSAETDSPPGLHGDRATQRDRVIESLRSENTQLKNLVVSLSKTIIQNVVAAGPTRSPTVTYD